MTNIKFVVRVNNGGTRAPAYEQRIDRSPVQMTTNRKQALIMGKFAAETICNYRSMIPSPADAGTACIPTAPMRIRGQNQRCRS